MIETLVRAAIDTTKDENAKPRLRRCLPALLSAVGHWDGSAAGEYTVVAATPKAAFMFCADSGRTSTRANFGSTRWRGRWSRPSSPRPRTRAM